MTVIIRTQDGRRGFETESRANLGVRFYLCKEFCDLYNVDGSLNFGVGSTIYQIANVCWEGLQTLFNEINSENVTGPIRILFYAPKEDDFFSILFCVKLKNPRVSKGDLTHFMGEYLCKNIPFPIFILLNNYEVHKALSIFDQDHADSGPDFQIEGKSALTYFDPVVITKDEEKEADRAAKGRRVLKGSSKTSQGQGSKKSEIDESQTNSQNDKSQNQTLNDEAQNQTPNQTDEAKTKEDESSDTKKDDESDTKKDDEGGAK